MARWAIWLSLFVAVCLGRSVNADTLPQDILFSASRSVVRIEAIRPARGVQVQVGTGIILAQGKIATACHVVRGATNISVIHGGRRYVVSGLHAMSERDVCVFSVSGLTARPAESRTAAQLQIGEQVIALGYSGGGPVRWSVGEVSRAHYFQGGYVLQSSASFTSGASGGPLLDSRGRVVGLLTFRMLEPGPRFYSVPIDWALDAVAMMGTAEGLDTDFDDLPFWQRSQDALPFFMRASSFETEQRWPELQALCDAWRQADPASGEPAFIESALEARSGHYDAARSKLEQAVSKDPRHALAWSALARLRLHFEDFSGARDAYSHLALLSMVLADRLRAEQSALRY